MNFIDYIIIAVLLLAALRGFSKGFLSSVITFVGTLIVIIIAFYLKNPISVLLYQYLPFISLGGKFAGVSVFNILIYEGVSYLLTVAFLSLILRVITKVTGVVDKLVNATVVLTLPNKILGAICGLLEGFVVAFVIVFILNIASVSTTKVNESKYGHPLLESTPILSGIVEDTYNSVSEIYQICTDYEAEVNKDEANLKSLKVLLKYDIITPNSTDKLIEMKKITTPGAKEAAEEARTKKENQ